MGEGTKIGTDTDILLSSFNVTDANHDTRGTETRAGFRFSKPSVFPLRGWWVAKMDRDGEPGQRQLGVGGLRNPVHPEMCRGHRTPLPALSSPGEQHYVKMVGLLSLQE